MCLRSTIIRVGSSKRHIGKGDHASKPHTSVPCTPICWLLVDLGSYGALLLDGVGAHGGLHYCKVRTNKTCWKVYVGHKHIKNVCTAHVYHACCR